MQRETVDTAILGWRKWCLRPRDTSQLMSMARCAATTWSRPRPVYFADRKPTRNNSNGIYAIANDCVTVVVGPYEISGIVAAQPGRVIEHRRGWRAHRVAIVAFIGIPKFHQAVADRYGVPLISIRQAQAVLRESESNVRITGAEYYGNWSAEEWTRAHIYLVGEGICQLEPPEELVDVCVDGRRAQYVGFGFGSQDCYIGGYTSRPSTFLRLAREFVAQAGYDPESFKVKVGV